MAQKLENCATLLLEALEMRPFDTSSEETLREKLSEMTDEELKQRMKSQTQRLAIPRKEFNI